MNNELKTELLEALRIGDDFAYGKYVRTGKPTRDIARSKIRAAIAKLENEPVDEIKLEEQGK